MALYREWIFKVSDDEMVIILAALGGRLKQAALVDKARDIGNRLTVQRIKELEDVTKRLRDSMTEEAPELLAQLDAEPQRG